MKKVLVPRHSRIFPTKLELDISESIPKKYGPEFFETYQDWFYFAHIDPVQRWIHALGMVIGYGIYIYCGYLAINLMVIPFIIWLLVGIFFYYGSGLISHSVYDRAAGKTTPDHFGDTFGTVHRFNLETLLGIYDYSLRKFIKKYPFVTEAFDLIEIKIEKLPQHLLTRNKEQKNARNL